jgi:RHS repeat-associated protein
VVDGMAVNYDPLLHLPTRIGDVRVVDLAGLTWRSDDRTWARTRSGTAEGLTIGSLTFLGARVLDQSSHQFLSPDPLLTVPASNGNASAYTYAWNDPVNFVDPSGLRPISREEWDAIRAREETGRIGQAWEAIGDDPWGAMVAGVVVVGGAALCFTPLAPIGAGVMIGAAVSAATGLAAGALDPRQVALGGVLGGISGGVGAVGFSATQSAFLGVGVGAAGDLGSQLIAGGRIDWKSVAVNGGVGGPAGAIGVRAQAYTASSGVRAAAVGAMTDGGSSVLTQALTGDHTIDVNRIALDAAGGAASVYAGHYFEPANVLDRRATGPRPDPVTVNRGTDLAVELQIRLETGLDPSEAGQAARAPGRELEVLGGPGVAQLSD